jgi:hypothetical protein
MQQQTMRCDSSLIHRSVIQRVQRATFPTSSSISKAAALAFQGPNKHSLVSDKNSAVEVEDLCKDSAVFLWRGQGYLDQQGYYIIYCK